MTPQSPPKTRGAVRIPFTSFVDDEFQGGGAGCLRSQKEFALLTPGSYLAGLRGALALGAPALAAWLLGFAAPAIEPGVALAARAGALYALTLTAFASAPRMRRDDLAASAAGLACVAEAFRAVMVHHVDLVPLAVDIAGVFAAWAPAGVEHYRRLARDARYVPFRELSLNDRRVARGRVRSGTPQAALSR